VFLDGDSCTSEDHLSRQWLKLGWPLLLSQRRQMQMQFSRANTVLPELEMDATIGLKAMSTSRHCKEERTQ
jgi:hypothetical protein